MQITRTITPEQADRALERLRHAPDEVSDLEVVLYGAFRNAYTLLVGWRFAFIVALIGNIVQFFLSR